MLLSRVYSLDSLAPIFEVTAEHARVDDLHVKRFYYWFVVLGANVELEDDAELPAVRSLPIVLMDG